MLMADNSLNNWNFDEGLPDDDGSDDRLCFDMDSFWDMIGDTPDCSEIKPEDLPVKIVPEGLPELEGPSSLGAELPGSDTCSYSFNSEASDSRIGSSESSFDSAAKSVLNFDSAKQNLAQNGSPVHSLSGGLVNWISQQPYCYTSQDIQYELPNFPSASSFTAGDSHHVSDVRGTLDPNHVKGKTEFELRCLNSNSNSRCMYNSMEKSDIAHGTYGEIGENSFQTLRAPNIVESMVNPELSGVELPDLEISSALDFYNQYSHTQYSIGAESPLYFGPTSRQCHTENFGAQYVTNNVERMVNTKDEEGKFPPKGAMYFENQVERSDGAVLPVSAMWNANVSGLNDFGLAVGNTSSTQILGHSLSNMSSMNQGVHMKDEKNDEVYASQGTECPSFMAIDGLSSKKQAFDVKNEKDKLFASQGNGYRSFVDVNNVAGWKPSGVFDGFSSKKQTLHVKDEKNVNGSRRAQHSLVKDEKICKIISPVAESRFSDVQASEQKPCLQQSKSISRLLGPKLEDRENKLTQSKSIVGSQHIKVSHQTLDDDDDVCILEELSEPAHRNQSAVNVKSHISSRISSLIDSRNRFEVDGVRLKTNDERIIYRAALQDLSQPKSEATPPDGVLSVPLLRHQRIALSWMVQKETSSIQPCSGGILADDQGLGKTISTIALILKERSPSSRMSTITSNQMETLDLDDDDGVTELNGTSQTMADRILATGRDPPVQAKGRPAAGTLIVCPTSVLRQWSDELHNKVTSEANLSVLTYHGGNRTKDPLELAKYDVVLTTYAIVSMEVPKQPLVDKDDDERRKRSHTPPMGHPSTKKRKYPPNSDKRCSKSKKGGEDELLESSISRPLAQVRWFRVVLDEAQSIKNYRTQVARACWGLRAKRRWCLSGTPIQNAIDDLYSYFRFLKYDPYAVFKSFCSTIKVPIQKNPTNGYRKLQAVLKTIMLRRTKGTLLDGEPIINLPPKTIELKKVEFTLEERDFYCKLEADSRAQFAEYAAAGTVKQNYVNILLMLLRLRQACDHPLLVRGCGSNTMWTSSAEVAKKLPPEKLASLLNCLEASLAICGICNDAPEDAVVTSCGHVFCNQCICEHLTGDDNQCPTPNCKVRLSVSSVFARATLKNSLSEGHEIAADCSGSVLAETPQPCSAVGLFDSSKIKAALEVLQSLSRPRDLMLRASSLINIDGGASCPENRDVCNKQIVDMDGDRKSLVPVVGEKAIVFSQWTRMLDLLEASLKDSSINYRRLDGTMSVAARDKAVKDFNTQPEVSVMIMSLKAASLGLNMVAACHVILLDLWWNPTTEDQAIDRAHRIGQTRPVSVLRLTVKDTVEDRILALQQKKREMVSSAFGEDETGSRQTRLTVEDLNYLFMYN